MSYPLCFFNVIIKLFSKYWCTDDSWNSQVKLIWLYVFCAKWVLREDWPVRGDTRAVSTECDNRAVGIIKFAVSGLVLRAVANKILL